LTPAQIIHNALRSTRTDVPFSRTGSAAYRSVDTIGDGATVLRAKTR